MHLRVPGQVRVCTSVPVGSPAQAGAYACSHVCPGARAQPSCVSGDRAVAVIPAAWLWESSGGRAVSGWAPRHAGWGSRLDGHPAGPLPVQWGHRHAKITGAQGPRAASPTPPVEAWQPTAIPDAHHGPLPRSKPRSCLGSSDPSTLQLAVPQSAHSEPACSRASQPAARPAAGARSAREPTLPPGGTASPSRPDRGRSGGSERAAASGSDRPRSRSWPGGFGQFASPLCASVSHSRLGVWCEYRRRFQGEAPVPCWPLPPRSTRSRDPDCSPGPRLTCLPTCLSEMALSLQGGQGSLSPLSRVYSLSRSK